MANIFFFGCRAELLLNHLNFVGDGSCVHFWYDLWCVDSPFKDLFPDFFRLTVDKEVSIASYLVNEGDRSIWSWNPQFS